MPQWTTSIHWWLTQCLWFKTSNILYLSFFLLLTTRLHSSCFAFWESTFNVGLIDYCNWTVVFASTLRQLLFDPLPTLVLIFANIVNHSTKLNIVPVVVGPIQHIRTGTIHLSDRWQARTTNEDRNIHVSMWTIFLHFFSLFSFLKSIHWDYLVTQKQTRSTIWM